MSRFRVFDSIRRVAPVPCRGAPRVVRDGSGRALVCGIGTGATLCGAGAYLKRRRAGVRAVAVEPAGSALLSGREPGRHAIPGLNGGFIAPTTDRALIDDVVAVTDDDAMQTAGSLARDRGLLVGVSSGAAAHAAFLVARRPEMADTTIVVVLPDTGERYLSVWPRGGEHL